MSTITLRILQMMGINEQTMPLLNNRKLTKFMGRIYAGYKRNVEYHNDIHGADVLQMMFVILK